VNFKIALTVCSVLISPAALGQDARQILERARLAATLTKLDRRLDGEINSKIPIALFLQEKDIQFQFDEGKGWESFHLRLKDDSCELFEMIGGRQRNFPEAKITQSIAGTDLTYEDLALRFFYWPNPVLEGREKMKGSDSYKLRLNKPKGMAGRYDTVYVWVDVKQGAFSLIKGFNNSRLLKEFSVEKVMEIGGGVWTLERMKISSFTGEPGHERTSSITNLVFKDPNKAKPKGLKK